MINSSFAMEEFQAFLRKAKDAVHHIEDYERIYLVLGNESCDLDSTISALSLAYLINLQNSTLSNYAVIPILNVEAKHFPLRTETCYLLEKYGIDYNVLVFRDQIQYSDFIESKEVETSLVDHHVLSFHDSILEETVVQIFDHRTIDKEDICTSKKIGKQRIKIVGSCATLIAEEIINSELEVLFEELSRLLYATIIYDTIGLDQECGKTFEEDITVAQILEAILEIPSERKELFNSLWKIHNDTSNCTTKDLLYRDLKIVHQVPIPGLPMLVEDYLKREDSDEAITSFAKECKTCNLVIIGIDASKEIKRDVAIFSTSSHHRQILLTTFKNCRELSLTEIRTKNIYITCFKQGNIKLTRKFILPLVQKATSELAWKLD